jgi:PAS domain S-box-containing protein
MGMKESKDKAHHNSFSDAKMAIRKSIHKHEGKLDVKEDPKIAIEVLDDEIKSYRPIEQALVAEHLFRKTIEESIGVGIAGFDLNWKQIYVNRIFCNMVGWSAADLMNMPHPQPYLIPCAGDPAAPSLVELIDRGVSSPQGFEYQLKHKNGTCFWTLIHSNVLPDSNGESIGRLISVADINHQKKAEYTLRQLSTSLIDAQERERKLVAQDLHDSIAGRLAGIKYGMEKILARIDPENVEIGDVLQDTIEVVRSTLEATRRISRNLHPSILDDLGLLSAVRGYCREFQQLYPHIRMDLKLALNEERVPDALKILTYRVLQEALNNVAKHSRAKNVKVVLVHRFRRLVLKIKDDGKGFSRENLPTSPETSHGMGIRGMQERAQLFGGTFDLDSRPGRGTSIRVAWRMDGH